MNYKILFAYFHHFSIWLNIHVLFIKIFSHHSLDLSLLWDDVTSFARCSFRFFDTVRLQFECFQSSFVNFGFEQQKILFHKQHNINLHVIKYALGQCALNTR